VAGEEVGFSTKSNSRKNYAMMEAAAKNVAERLSGEQVILVCLGEERTTERVGQAEIRFIPYQKDANIAARYYQAADVYVHAAKVEVLENSETKSGGYR